MKRDGEKRGDSVKERREVFRVRGAETGEEAGEDREMVANIIELKRWSGAISKQVGVWSEKERARY